MYVLGTVIRAVGRERILEEFLGLAYLFKILRIVCSHQVYANRNKYHRCPSFMLPIVHLTYGLVRDGEDLQPLDQLWLHPDYN